MPVPTARRPHPIAVSGAVLEGELLFPTDLHGVAVFAHPYPPMGGSMENNVVLAATVALADHGLAALRFNFRGVGAGTGVFTEGPEAVADNVAAIDSVAGLVPGGRLIVGGYSFGALTAAAASVGRADVNGVLLIAPPTSMFEPPPLADVPGPLVVLVGDADPYSDPEDVERLLAGRDDARLIVEPGVDHFWWGAEDRVARAVASLCG